MELDEALKHFLACGYTADDWALTEPYDDGVDTYRWVLSARGSFSAEFVHEHDARLALAAIRAALRESQFVLPFVLPLEGKSNG